MQFTTKELQYLHTGLLTRERFIQKLMAGWDASRGPIEKDLLELYTQELNEVRDLIDRVGDEFGAAKIVW